PGAPAGPGARSRCAGARRRTRGARDPTPAGTGGRPHPVRRLVLAAPLVAVVAVALLVAALRSSGGDGPSPSTTSADGRPAVDPAASTARFLDGYVGADGRVSRPDQGGDTVSEGQAYAMVLAVAANDPTRF